MGLRKSPPHTYFKTINGIQYLYARKQIKGKVYQEVLGRADELSQQKALRARDEFLLKLRNGGKNPSSRNSELPALKITSTSKIDQFPNPTLKEYYDGFDIIYGTLRTLDQYKRHFRFLIDFLGEDIKLHQLTREQAFNFYQHHRDITKLADKTLMNMKRSLVAVYSKAMKIGKIFDDLKNPFSYIPKLKTKIRKRIASKEEEELLYRNAQEWVIPILITAFNTGLREENLLSLKWSNVRWKLRSFYVTHAKINQEGYVPWNTNMQKLMLLLKEHKGSNEHLFLNKYGIPYHKEGDDNSGRRALRTTFRTTRRNAGIEDFTFHDIRKTVKTRLASKGVSSDHSDYLLGHVYEGARKFYIHLGEDDIEDLRSSFEKLLFYNSAYLNKYLDIPSSTKKTCIKCKTEFDSSLKFCSYCGKLLKNLY